MHALILSKKKKESLDQLTEWVVEKFSSVTNKNIPVPSFPGHPLTKNEIMKQIFVKSVKKNRTLDVTFPFPDQIPYYQSQVRVQLLGNRLLRYLPFYI